MRDAIRSLKNSGYVLRGGCWFGVARRRRSAYRDALVPDCRSGLHGFRMAVVLRGEHIRTLRGGGWVSSARYCRSAYCSADPPGNRGEDIGFRVVLRGRPQMRDTIRSIESDDHVLRGGCWNDVSWLCRSAFRSAYHSGNHDDDVGFRVVVVLHGKRNHRGIES